MAIVVLVTAKDLEEAEKISESLLDQKLIACVKITSEVKSIFQWEGKVTSSKEVLMIMKTKQDKFHAIIKTVKQLHSYTTPEIIALPIISGDDDYLDWINKSVQ